MVPVLLSDSFAIGPANMQAMVAIATTNSCTSKPQLFLWNMRCLNTVTVSHASPRLLTVTNEDSGTSEFWQRTLVLPRCQQCLEKAQTPTVPRTEMIRLSAAWTLVRPQRVDRLTHATVIVGSSGNKTAK